MLKITEKQTDELWGGVGPYSEAKLIFETRILDDKISRTFMDVVVAINPTTFEICEQNMKKFQGIEIMKELFGNAKNKGKGYGYISKVFSVSYNRSNPKEIDEVFREAKIALEYSEKAIISLHEFVIEFLEIDLENLGT